jgi:hypothetical protein
MTTDSKKNLLEDLKQTLKGKFAKNLVEAYAKSFDYANLARAFLEQLDEEVSKEDEA